MRRALLGGLLFTAAVSLALVAAEVGLRVVGPDHSYIWAPGAEGVLHPNPVHIPGVEGPARFRAGEHGLRAKPLPAAAAITVVALGGSTTECIYLDVGETWPDLLARRLTAFSGGRAWVGNGGRSGLRLRHHLFQAEAVLDQFSDLGVLIVMAGANDLLKYLSDPAENLDWWSDPGEMIRVYYEAFELPRRPSVGPVYERTELLRVLRLTKRRFERAVEPDIYLEIANDGRTQTTWRQIRQEAVELVDSLPSLDELLTAYERDLTALRALTDAHEAELVLVTQPTMWAEAMPDELESLLWMGEVGNARGSGAGRYYSPRALAEGMEAVNALILRFCATHDLICVDLAEQLPKDTTVFYDDMHFNESGATRVAAALAPPVADLAGLKP